jgi:nicotinamide-nucleotide amidase
MNAEIISIGTELLLGRNLDTNSQWLSLRLAEMGVPVSHHTTVGDDRADNVAALRTAVARSSLIITTGGLGPTLDDLTREVVAELGGVPLVLDQPSLDTIEAMFSRRSRPMPERNRSQAYFPEGATPIPNANGTAPGIWMEVGRAVIVCLPGVPGEMKPMFIDWVTPRIRTHFGGGRATVVRTIRTYGTGESHIEEMLGDLIQRGRDPEIGITASEATITLRVVSRADTPEAAMAKADPDLAFIRERLGHLIYGEEDEDMADVVGRMLAERGRTVATAESCTGGLVGHLLTEVPGSSRYYLGGFVVYSNEAKTQFCDVPAAMIAEHGAVSKQVAEAIATGVRKNFAADFGIGVTGVAGPDGGTAAKPVGLVYIAVADADGCEILQSNWPADRSSIKIRSAKSALNLLRLRLLKSMDHSPRSGRGQ